MEVSRYWLKRGDGADGGEKGGGGREGGREGDYFFSSILLSIQSHKTQRDLENPIF